MANLDIALGNRSEKTGRFNFVRGADGDVAFDDSCEHEVATSVTEVKGSWWADPEHGSKLRTLRSVTTVTPSQAEATTFEALAPLEAAGDISGVTVRAVAERSAGQRTGRLRVEIAWTTPGGRTSSITVR